MKDNADFSRDNFAAKVSDTSFQDRVRGVPLGGAIGVAFGYSLEFIPSEADIKTTYGASGLTEYDLSYPWLDENRVRAETVFSPTRLYSMVVRSSTTATDVALLCVSLP